jgi:hypothetical protein
MRAFKIRKNGSDGAIDDQIVTYQPYVGAYADSSSDNDVGLLLDSGVIEVASGDYFEIWAMSTWSVSSPSLPAYDSYFACEEIA